MYADSGVNASSRRSPSYAAALAQGRAATKAGRYDEAISIFKAAKESEDADEPGPRAVGELGYAQLLAKRTSEAVKTLSPLWDSSFDYRLRAEVAYNLGLAEDALQHSDKALEWYLYSQLLRPSRAAEGRIKGKSFCSATVDTKAVPATTHENWLAAIRELKLDFEDPNEPDAPPPTTEAEAKKRLCSDDACTSIASGPPDTGGPWMREHRFVIRRPDGSLRVSTTYFNDLRAAGAMVCDVSPSHGVVRRDGVIQVISAGLSSVKARGTARGEHCSNDTESCAYDCFVTDYVRTDTFYDEKTLDEVARVRQFTPCGKACGGPEKILEIAIQGDDVTFSGDDGSTMRSPIRVSTKEGRVVLSGPPFCEKSVPIVKR